MNDHIVLVGAARPALAGQRVQAQDKSKPQPMIGVIAGWDDSQTQVDLHLVTPDGQHAFLVRPAITTHPCQNFQVFKI